MNRTPSHPVITLLLPSLALVACATVPVAPTAPPLPLDGFAALLSGTTEGLAKSRQIFAGDASSPAAALGLALALDEAGERDATLPAWLSAIERAAPAICRDTSGGRDPRGCDPWAAPTLRVAIAALAASIDDLASLPELAKRTQALTKLTEGVLRPTEAGDLHLLLASLHARLGDRATADRHLQRAGCGGTFFVAGPFGELPTLDLDRPFDHQAMRRHTALGCRVGLDGPRGRSGVLYAGRKLVAARSTRLLVELEDTGPLRLLLDGKLVYANNEEDRPPPGNRRLMLELDAGEHELWIKVAAPEGKAEIGLALLADDEVKMLDQPPSGKPEAGAASRQASLLEEPLVARASALRATDSVDSHVELLYGTLLALAERAGDRAEELGQALASVRRTSATAQLLLALSYLADNSRPARFSSDLARRALGNALRQRPTLRRATEALVELDLAEDKARNAASRAAEVPTGTDWRIDVLRYRALRARSLGEQAEPILDAALTARRLACPVLSAAVQLYRERRELGRLADVAERYARCSEGRELKAELAAERFDYATAIAEYRRILQRNPHRQAARRELARALRSSGAVPDAVKELEQLVEEAPRNVVFRVELADALVEAGDRPRAIAILTAGQKEQPESEELSRALFSLDGKARALRWLEPYRVDGLRLIDMYRADPLPAGRAPAVLVLDRTVAYVFGSGARLTLTHNIIQLMSKEGIAKFAEVEVPEGAELIRLRVVKRDGSVREAERVSGKQTPSLPDLDVGDYIEFEHVESTGAPAAFPGGFLSERFYFQSFDAPLDRSEYVVVAPKAMALQVDERGGAPAAQRKELDDVAILTWQVRHAAQAVGEPEAVSHAEFLPSVRVASGLTQTQWQRFLVNGQAALLRPNSAIRALVGELVRGVSEPRERLRVLDAWVRNNIQGGGSIDERASFILERRQGSRSQLLLALLRAAHVDAEMVLGRPLGSPDVDGPLPDLESFNEPLLLVRDGKSTIAVDPRYRHGPPGVLSAKLRGQPALRIATSGPTTTTLPEAHRDSRKMTIDWELDAKLGSRVKVTELLDGMPALEWREAIETLPVDRIRPEFEQQTLGQHFPGASLVSLQWQNEKADEQPLTVSYEFLLPTSGRQIERATLLSAPYPAALLRRYGQRRERRTTMRIAFVAPTEIVTTYHGAVVPEAIAPVELQTPYGTFSLAGDRSPTALRLTTKLAMPASLVRPADYAAFIRFAATVDQAEATAAKITR